MSVLFRQQRGGLQESIETTRVVGSVKQLRDLFRLPPDTKITVEFYADDPRIPWHNTHIVVAENWGVLGFTDGPLE